jgi:predicted Zn-dependent protease
MKAPAYFFDGETAITHRVEASLNGNRLSIAGATIGSPRAWELDELEAAERVESDRPLRLRSRSSPGERLIVEERTMIAALLSRAPQLIRPQSRRRILRYALITAAGLLLVAAIGYALLSMLPPAVAHLMPEEWRQRLGRQTERSLVANFTECKSPAGLRALGLIGSRLYAGNADIAPDFSIGVYSLPVINAFTLPGGRILLSGKLITAAKTPDEVAGVLAHELGHVHNRDPEVAIIRFTGMQVLLSLATGSDGGGVVSNLAGLAAFLRYTRAAEIEADDYAVKLLNRTKIDPMGLKRFFESIEKMDEARRRSMGPLDGILATHPATKERIARIEPLKEGPALPVLSGEDWLALRSICGKG